MLEVTAGPPPGFRAVFPPAAQLATALQDSGYVIRMGEANKQFPIEYCLTGYSPNANGNNVGVPYFGIQLPPPPGMDSLYSIQLNYNIREDEAVVLIGRTPPKCKYFSYRSYLMNRYYDFPMPPTRKKINASLWETTSLYRMRPDLPLDSIFGRKFAVIMSADSLLATRVKEIILHATPEIEPADIHFDILPAGDIFHCGISPKADWINFLHRVSFFDDPAEEHEYLDHPPLEVIRLTKADSAAQVLFAVRPFLPRASGMTEFNLFQDIGLIENGIYETYHDRYDITWLSSTPFNIESYTAIQQGLDAYGDNHDCLYTLTHDFILGENDLTLAYGVDHARSGMAVYNNVVIYGSKYLHGFGGMTNDLMEKSTRQFAADTLIADNLYAYGFSRHPVPGNPFVFIVPSDTFNTLSGINPGDNVFLCTRLYVNPVTKIGPDPLEVVIDRFVLLRAKSTGTFEAEITRPSVKVFPNPVKDKVRIEVEVPEWSGVELLLFNPGGQQVGKAIRFDHVRGKVWQDVNFGSGQPPGVYFLKVIIHENGGQERRVMTSKVVFLQ